MRSMSKVSCPERPVQFPDDTNTTNEVIKSLLGTPINCTEIQELKTGQELNGVDYSIIVINSAPAWVPDIWPSSISERFYDLPGAEEASALDSLENEKRVAFYMATSDVHEVPEYLIRHLWEKSLQEETTWPGLIELWNSSFSDTMAEAVDKQTSSTKTAPV